MDSVAQAPPPEKLTVPIRGKETVEVFVRHKRRSPRARSRVKDYRKCGSPKHLYIYRHGGTQRISAKTNS